MVFSCHCHPYSVQLKLCVALSPPSDDDEPIVPDAQPPSPSGEHAAEQCGPVVSEERPVKALPDPSSAHLSVKRRR